MANYFPLSYPITHSERPAPKARKPAEPQKTTSAPGSELHAAVKLLVDSQKPHFDKQQERVHRREPDWEYGDYVSRSSDPFCTTPSPPITPGPVVHYIPEILPPTMESTQSKGRKKKVLLMVRSPAGSAGLAEPAGSAGSAGLAAFPLVLGGRMDG